MNHKAPDEYSKQRGEEFNRHMLGKTIKLIDASCINYIVISFTDGSSVSLDADEKNIVGIPVINVMKGKT